MSLEKIASSNIIEFLNHFTFKKRVHIWHWFIILSYELAVFCGQLIFSQKLEEEFSIYKKK